MTTYVDKLVIWPFAKPPFHKGACHLFADSIEELHDFATMIDLRRAWFQEHPIMDYYDLTPRKRAEAILKGAIPVDYRKLRHLRKAKETP